MEEINLDYNFFNSCTSLSDAARKIFNNDNYRKTEKIKVLCEKCGFDWHIWAERRAAKKEVSYCLNCGKKIEYFPSRKNNKKFCCSSCAATYNNLNNRHLEKHTQCVYCGKSLEGHSKYSKYCSVECHSKDVQDQYIKKWKLGEEKGSSGLYGISKRIKMYLFEKYNCKCQKCGWGEINPSTGNVPLQVHHIDGDCTNNREENLELLCPNCHSLTENFGNLNKNSKRVFRKQKGNI